MSGDPVRRYTVLDAGVSYPASLHPTDVGWRLKFGQGGCVMFAVYYPRHGNVSAEDRAAVMEELATAHLEGVTYRQTCSADGEMPRGTGTVGMLRSAMKLLKVLFPAVTGATFKDTSRTDCALGTSVSLRHSYLARHSATWYQRHFGAQPCNPEALADLARGAAKMASRPPANGFDDFFETVVLAVKGYRVRVKDFKGVLRKNYVGDVDKGLPPAPSYAEFVQRLNNIDCIMLESWITRFVDDAFGVAARDDYYWRIEIPDVKPDSSDALKVTLLDAAPLGPDAERLGGGRPGDPTAADDDGGRFEFRSVWTPRPNFSQIQFLDVPRTVR